MRKDQSIFKDKEYLGYSSIGTMPQRSYYIPFLENETFVFKDKILDRTESSCFISLDGEWKFQDYSDFNQVDINGVLKKTIDGIFVYRRCDPLKFGGHSKHPFEEKIQNQ